MTVTTRAPKWDDFDPEEMEWPERKVVIIHGDYQAYLEQRIPPIVRSQPHWCAKNLTSVELERLIAAVTEIPNPILESALYAHPALGCGIEQFPDDFLRRLKSATERELATMAQVWAASMSTPDYTHSVSGKRLSDGWSPEDALGILNSIAELAKKQAPGQVLYLLIES